MESGLDDWDLLNQQLDDAQRAQMASEARNMMNKFGRVSCFFEGRYDAYNGELITSNK